MDQKQLMAEVNSLPVDERVAFIDQLLHTLHPASSRIEKAWAEVARRRLQEIQNGEVQPTPSDQVFANLRQRITS